MYKLLRAIEPVHLARRRHMSVPIPRRSTEFDQKGAIIELLQLPRNSGFVNPNFLAKGSWRSGLPMRTREHRGRRIFFRQCIERAPDRLKRRKSDFLEGAAQAECVGDAIHIL